MMRVSKAEKADALAISGSNAVHSVCSALQTYKLHHVSHDMCGTSAKSRQAAK